MRIAPLLLGVVLLSVACGDVNPLRGGSDTPASAPDPAVSGGGIGGTGKGTITGFGSVIINGTRHFETNAATELRIDGETVTEERLRAESAGMTARVDVGKDVSEDFSSGTALRVDAQTLVKGPVTGIDPLEVLGQTVLVTGDTVRPDALDPATLSVGRIVAVSGHADAANSIQATRLELKAAGLAEWKLTGPVSNLVAGTSFTIGSQSVNFSGITPKDCDSGLADGLRVKVKATADAAFTAASALTTTTAVECSPQGIEVPPDMTTGTLRAELEGFVSAVALPDFTVAGQTVRTTTATLYEHGDVTDLLPGTRVEVVGTLDVATRVLAAAKVEFREGRVRIQAPLTAADVATDLRSLTILGIQAWRTPMTQDEAGIFAHAPLNAQVELSGFTDGSGQVFITEIKAEGTPEPNRVRLRGPVSSTGSAPTFAILGLSIDTTNADFTDDQKRVISAAEFFTRLRVGDLVSVEDGTYDGATHTLHSVKKVEFED